MGEQISAVSSLVRFGAFEFNATAGELRKNGTKVRLEGQPIAVLGILLECPGQLVSRDELRRRLWPADTFVDFESSINAAIMRLRQALDDSAESPRYVQTLPRRGYRFIYPVGDPAAGLLSRQKLVKSTGRLWAGTAAGVAVAVVLVAAYFGWVRERRIEPGVPPVSSLAVLPLENLTGDVGQEYFVDGIHDELITRLAQVSALKVVSRTSVTRYRGQSRPLPEVARELNVDAILEGSVRRENGHVHVTAQLIHGATDRHLWAASYDRELSALPALPVEIALTISKELNIPVTQRDRARLGGVAAADPAAYLAVLKGRYFAAKWTEEGLRQGMEQFREAIDRDPTYAPAYEGLGRCYELLASSGYAAPADAYPKARAAIQKALELDDHLADAHQLLARIKMMYDWDGKGAAREFERVRELDPNWEGPTGYLVYTGRFDEAASAAKRAVERDPLGLSTNLVLGWVYFQAGRYQEAIAQQKKTLELNQDYAPAHAQLSWNYVMQRKYAEAFAECNMAMDIVRRHGQQPLHLGCGWVFAAAGKRNDALRFARQLETLRAHRWVDPAELARTYGWLGDDDTAIVYLEQAYAERAPSMVRLKFGRGFPESLRGDARFAALEKQVSFP